MDVLSAAQVVQYVDTLADTARHTFRAEAYRCLNPKNFFELCRFHLSLLVDLPVHFMYYVPSTSEERLSQPKKTTSGQKGLLSAFFRKGTQYESDSNTADIARVYVNMTKLVDFLARGDHMKAEGVFRKVGNVVRQREIARRILTCNTLVFPLVPVPNSRAALGEASLLHVVDDNTSVPSCSDFSVHDYASSLKKILTAIQEPLLTLRLLPIFISVAELTKGNTDRNGERTPLQPMDLRIAKAKQLKAVRLLALLLPDRNQCLLKRLLDLLSKTLECTEFNRMTVDSLGTIFGPVLFAPANICPEELHRQHSAFSGLASLMIAQGSRGVFALPRTLSEDIDINMAREYPLSPTTAIQEMQGTPTVCTSVKFAHRSSPKRVQVNDLSSTEYAVAELFATVHALSDKDPQKMRFLSRQKCRRLDTLNSVFLAKTGDRREPASTSDESGSGVFGCLKRACPKSPSRTPVKRVRREAASNTAFNTPIKLVPSESSVNLRSIFKRSRPTLDCKLRVKRRYHQHLDTSTSDHKFMF